MESPRTRAEGINTLKPTMVPAKKAVVRNQPATPNNPTPANTVTVAINNAAKVKRQCWPNHRALNCHQSFMTHLACCVWPDQVCPHDTDSPQWATDPFQYVAPCAQ